METSKQTIIDLQEIWSGSLTACHVRSLRPWTFAQQPTSRVGLLSLSSRYHNRCVAYTGSLQESCQLLTYSQLTIQEDKEIGAEETGFTQEETRWQGTIRGREVPDEKVPASHKEVQGGGEGSRDSQRYSSPTAERQSKTVAVD